MAVTPPIRHPYYYFDDGNLVIQVENTLFNVLRSTLTRHSRVFCDIFSLPQSNTLSGQVPDGSSDFAPVHLQGISSIDFERLLCILYPPIYGAHTPKTSDEWISILHLATRWEFDDVRALAIRELEQYPFSALKIIMLSQHFDFCTPWTLKAYTELCERRKELTSDEETVLGFRTATRIALLRERLRTTPKKPKIVTLPGPVRGPVRRPSPSNEDDGSKEKTPSRSKTDGGILSAVRRSSPVPIRGFRSKNSKHPACSRLVAEVFGLLDN